MITREVDKQLIEDMRTTSERHSNLPGGLFECRCGFVAPSRDVYLRLVGLSTQRLRERVCERECRDHTLAELAKAVIAWTER